MLRSTQYVIIVTENLKCYIMYAAAYHVIVLRFRSRNFRAKKIRQNHFGVARSYSVLRLNGGLQSTRFKTNNIYMPNLILY